MVTWIATLAGSTVGCTQANDREGPKHECERGEESEVVFVLTIDGVFQLSGRGTIVFGIVQAGTVSVGDCLVLSSDGSTFVCSGIELVQKRPRVEGFLAIRLVDLAGNPADPEPFSKGAVLRGIFEFR